MNYCFTLGYEFNYNVLTVLVGDFVVFLPIKNIKTIVPGNSYKKNPSLVSSVMTITVIFTSFVLNQMCTFDVQHMKFLFLSVKQ